MMLYAQPYFAPAFGGSLRSSIRMQRRFVRTTETRQILQDNFSERPVECLLIRMAPTAKRKTQRFE